MALLNIANDHLRSVLNVKYLLNDLDEVALSSCMETLFETWSKKDILKLMIKYSNKQQLESMTNIMDEALIISQNKSTNNIFDTVTSKSVMNILSYLTREDIQNLKLSCIRMGILCLQQMDFKSHHNQNGKYLLTKQNSKNNLISSLSLSKSTLKGPWIDKWKKHITNLSSTGQSYKLQANALSCEYDDNNIKKCGCIQRLLIIFSYVNKSTVVCFNNEYIFYMLYPNLFESKQGNTY